jgi:ABC-type dipeptide/oligopeptide/nickel transport system permease component
MRMWIFVVRRLILLIPVIVGVMTILFLLLSSLPVANRLQAQFGFAPDPTSPCPPPNENQTCTNPTYALLVGKLGLNQPVPVQWGIYIYNAFTFHWGVVSNFSTAADTFVVMRGQSVTTVLGWFLPYTVELALLSLAIIFTAAFPLGRLAAANRNRPVDHAARVMSFAGYALPAFLLGSLVLMGAVVLFGASTGYFSRTPWCPSGDATFTEFYGSWPPLSCFGGTEYPGWLTVGVISQPTGFPTVDAILHGQYWLALDTLLRMILPALVIAFGSIAILLRYVRNSMLEVMNLDFIRTARADGIPEKIVIRRHAARNSLSATVTVLGLTFAFFIGGFPVLEDIFHLSGIGLLLALSVQSTNGGQIDYGLIVGITLVFTYLVVLANLTIDVVYAYLDPRVRLG